jgi:hypothetical protein
VPRSNYIERNRLDTVSNDSAILIGSRVFIDALCPAPNSALQRTVTHKVLGRGRPSGVISSGRIRARVLMRHPAAAELGR